MSADAAPVAASSNATNEKIEPIVLLENGHSATPVATLPTISEPENATESFGMPMVKVKTAIYNEEATTGKKLVPFLAPEFTSHPTALPALTPAHETQYAALLEHCTNIIMLPVSSAKDAESRELDELERMWLTRECLLRYLRASKWDLPHATKRIDATLVWRREYGLAGHTADYISPENETGKQVILGYDNECRPCLYLNPSRQNTERSPKQIQHLVYMIERVVDLMPPGQETLALLVDFGSSSKTSNPSITQAREVLNILQNHYPERLGRALVINIPWFVWGFFKLINPFIDPLTREKLKFNEDLRQHVPPMQLHKAFGGDCDFEYDHSKFWPELTRLTGEKRAQFVARWNASGSEIGASEFELKGGENEGMAALSINSRSLGLIVE